MNQTVIINRKARHHEHLLQFGVKNYATALLLNGKCGLTIAGGGCSARENSSSF